MTGSTIILIGGPMTLSDGSTLDSRQRLEDDPYSLASLRGLVHSLPWWLTVSSVVEPILREHGEKSFALVIGQRSVKEMRWEGSVKRVALRGLLKGGVSEVVMWWSPGEDALPEDFEEIATHRYWNGDKAGTLGLRRHSSDARWVFLKGNEFTLKDAGHAIAPTVLIDAEGVLLPGPRDIEKTENWPYQTFEAFEARRLFAPYLVLPHTHHVRAFVEAYLSWLERQRPNQGQIQEPPEMQNVSAARDPIDHVQPFAVEANFGVTGLVEADRWSRHGDLEAARALLATRYDLRIGLFDLARNPLLRETLLRDSQPIADVTSSSKVPEVVMSRAVKDARAASARREHEQSATQRASSKLLTYLKQAGWQARKAWGPGALWLPLTEEFTRWPGDDPFPLLWLELNIIKHQTTVGIGTTEYNRLDLPGWVAERRSEFERLAGPLPERRNPGHMEIWRCPSGWATDTDWSAEGGRVVELTSQWMAILEDLASKCVETWTSVFAPPTT